KKTSTSLPRANCASSCPRSTPRRRWCSVAIPRRRGHWVARSPTTVASTRRQSSHRSPARTRSRRRIVLPVTSADIRLFLHILGATVWVGGQIALAGVVPVVRRHAGVETVRLVARRFQQVAWPAFLLLLVTGIWNLFAVKIGDQDTEYFTTL